MSVLVEFHEEKLETMKELTCEVVDASNDIFGRTDVRKTYAIPKLYYRHRLKRSMVMWDNLLMLRQKIPELGNCQIYTAPLHFLVSDHVP